MRQMSPAAWQKILYSPFSTVIKNEYVKHLFYLLALFYGNIKKVIESFLYKRKY